MRHDTIYGALSSEIDAFRAAAPAETDAVRRVLAPAEEALARCDKCEMWNAMLDLRKLRLANVCGTVPN